MELIINKTGSETVSISDDSYNGPKEPTIIKWGGQLIQPIVDLVMALADGCMNIMQSSIMGGSDAYIAVDKSGNWIKWLIVVLIAVAAIVLFIVVSGGVGALASAMTAAGTGAGAGAAAGAAGATVGAAIKTCLIGAAESAVLALAKGVIVIVAVVGASNAVSFVDEALYPDVTVLPLFSMSPQELFKGEILLFDVNFFNPKEVLYNPEGNRMKYVQNGKEMESDQEFYYYVNENGQNIITSQQNSASELKSIISKWYFTLRNTAIVVLMVILVYVGIRMLISSVASDKAKYKKMIGDWFVALCIVFFIHYIMVFAVNLTETIVQIINNATSSVSYPVTFLNLKGNHRDKYKEAIENGGLEFSDFEFGNGFIWPTNLIGYARLQAQVQDGTAGYIGYSLCYIVLVLYTAYFTFVYGKRLLYLIFLTVIAPLVAITYPIDKMNDGKAQAFDIWFKEYIFNLLIQPLHLLLYTLLISMAFDFASKNIIYTLVAIGFMIPAEKFLRKMFNFEKASTPGLLGGAAGAALVMSGINNLSRRAGHSGKGHNKGNSDSSLAKENNKIRGYDSGKNFDNVLGGAGSSQSKEAIKDDAQPDTSDEAKRAMLDVDEEGFGTEGFNAQEYAARTAELNEEDNQGSPQGSDEEIRQELREAGHSEEEIAQMMGDNEENGAEPEEKIHLDSDGEDGNEGEPEELKDGDQDEGSDFDIDLDEDESVETADDSFAKRAGKAWKAGINVQGRRVINKENFKSATKTGLRLAGGAFGATIGLAAGISSGDLSKTLQYTSGGAVAGGAIASKPVDTIVDGASNSIENSKKRQEEFEKEYYGSDYSKHQREQVDLRFERDYQKRKEYAEGLGINKKYRQEIEKAKLMENKDKRDEAIKKAKEQRKKDIDKAMRAANEYRKYNVTDDGLIMKAMKSGNKSDKNRASKERIATAMVAANAKTQKDVDSYRERLSKQTNDQNTIDTIIRNAKSINPFI